MEPTTKPSPVHGILARSYSTFFAGLLIGIIIGNFIAIPISTKYSLSSIGIIIIVIGTMAIIWAQSTSRKTHGLRTDTVKENDHESFTKGPYQIFKYPTHIGLTFLVVGYALVDNSLVVLFFVLLSALISWIVFIPKQEKALTEKYGEAYLKYHKSMKI